MSTTTKLSKYFPHSLNKCFGRFIVLTTLLSLTILIPLNAQIKIVHNFVMDNDLNSPYGDLVTDSTWFYGMTSEGGAFNLGTIFKIKTDGSGFTKLLDFDGATKSPALMVLLPFRDQRCME